MTKVVPFRLLQPVGSSFCSTQKREAKWKIKKSADMQRFWREGFWS